MAVLEVYTVHDSKVGAFLAPWYARTRGEAIRSFTEACKDPNTMFGKYPADYRLWFVATYDEATGFFEVRKPEPVIGADELG